MRVARENNNLTPVVQTLDSPDPPDKSPPPVDKY